MIVHILGFNSVRFYLQQLLLPFPADRMEFQFRQVLFIAQGKENTTVTALFQFRQVLFIGSSRKNKNQEYPSFNSVRFYLQNLLFTVTESHTFVSIPLGSIYSNVVGQLIPALRRFNSVRFYLQTVTESHTFFIHQCFNSVRFYLQFTLLIFLIVAHHVSIPLGSIYRI